MRHCKAEMNETTDKDVTDDDTLKTFTSKFMLGHLMSKGGSKSS